MIKIKNQINFLIILLFLVLTNFLTSCGGGSKTVLPDAPPPYPDSPFVKKFNLVHLINQPLVTPLVEITTTGIGM